MHMDELVKNRLLESAEVKEKIAQSPMVGEIARIAKEIVNCFRRGGKVVLFGNGGSAADAQHIAAEFEGNSLIAKSDRFIFFVRSGRFWLIPC